MSSIAQRIEQIEKEKEELILKTINEKNQELREFADKYDLSIEVEKLKTNYIAYTIDIQLASRFEESLKDSVFTVSYSIIYYFIEDTYGLYIEEVETGTTLFDDGGMSLNEVLNSIENLTLNISLEKETTETWWIGQGDDLAEYENNCYSVTDDYSINPIKRLFLVLNDSDD